MAANEMLGTIVDLDEKLDKVIENFTDELANAIAEYYVYAIYDGKQEDDVLGDACNVVSHVEKQFLKSMTEEKFNDRLEKAIAYQAIHRFVYRPDLDEPKGLVAEILGNKLPSIDEPSAKIVIVNILKGQIEKVLVHTELDDLLEKLNFLHDNDYELEYAGNNTFVAAAKGAE